MLKNGQMWLDDQGMPIQAHGGCILEHRGVWYWYGEHKGADNCPGTSRVDVIGISCYSSQNLVDWHYEGLALSADRERCDSPLHPKKVCERPKVLYCEATGKFVMWMHLDDARYVQAQVGVAVADSPAGPFFLIRHMRPNGQDSRDMTLFQDTDGAAYLVHSSNWNKTLNVARLTADLQDLDGLYVSVLIDQEREAPALLKEGGQYYMVTSGCTGWNPNSALYAVSSHPLGKWKLIDNPCQGSGSRKTFLGQSAHIFRAGGTPWLLLDHWRPQDLQRSGYSILPILLQDGVMTIPWQDSFAPAL